MDKERDDYVSYLLRLRRSDQDGRPTWRASLESTHEGQKLYFHSVAALAAFLEARLGAGKEGGARIKETQCP